MADQARHSELDQYVGRMVQADATNLFEIGIRFVIVTACGAALFAAEGQAIIAVWVVGYIALTLLYVTSLRRYRAPISQAVYWTLLALHFIIAFWFAAMPVYVASFGTTAYLFVGGCGICGLAMHNITRRHTTPHVAWSDILSVAFSAAAIGYFYAIAGDELAITIVIGVASVSLVGYYVHTFIDMHRLRDRLDAQTAKDIQVQKMQAIGQLTAGIAHDFNNILTVIQGNLELFEALEDPEEKRKVLTEAHTSSQKAAQLVSQLLAFSRRSQIAPRALDLNKALEDFKTMTARVLPANIDIRMEMPNERYEVYVDEAMLQSAMLNIAVNARDAMAPTGGTLTITTRPVRQSRDAGPQVEIEMVDTGPGVAPDMIERLAEPFYTSKPVGEGSGLGLSMVQGFAEQSGGALGLENSESGGLRVRLTLPRPTADPHQEPSE
ncbi:sensor histidine kinase [Roseobacteraceae bacterium S113]